MGCLALSVHLEGRARAASDHLHLREKNRLCRTERNGKAHQKFKQSIKCKSSLNTKPKYSRFSSRNGSEAGWQPRGSHVRMWVEARLHEQNGGTVSKQPAKINQAKLTFGLQPCFRCLRLGEPLYHCFQANPLKGTD